ncbi:MAG: glycosyltransferase family 4 protein [Candidatus Omnitrophica bacterium]|nr:glycosyltransferase family 4 protein [Candidatus Omnitrophota bacterium]
MNILMIGPHDIHSASEPWTTRIKNLACQLAKKGHVVKLVYFPLDNNNAGKRFQENGYEAISLSRRLGSLVFLKNTAQITRLAGWADVVHFQKCYYYASLPALIGAWIKNKPAHYDWDDWETKIFYYSNPRKRVLGGFIHMLEKLMPLAVDTVSVSSRRLKELCLKAAVREDDIFPAPVGADINQFKPCPDQSHGIKTRYNTGRYLVLYIGQLHGGQYAELFIKAAGLILKKTKEVTFMIIGDGYRSVELKELASAQGLGRHMIFTGSLPHEIVPSYINSADICVACFEDNDITRCKSPLKIAEYLACGKAIVASNVGEVGNMIKDAGLLVKPGDCSALADGILKLVNDGGLRQALSSRARARAVEKYNWDFTASSLLSAYNKYLER